jgi:diadenosine tetraphosphatase ApaH/serine/threonine PP2A family protein phosphatase
VRAIVVADIHANLPAFEAVLGHAAARGPVDALWCLGDIVGYGPEPAACIELLRRYPHRAISGNHDLGAIGAIGTEDFNPQARAAVLWSATQLGAAERDWLAALPSVDVADDFTLVHGSLVDPVWAYLVDEDEAAAHFELQTTGACFVGHSHLPLVFEDTRGGVTGSYLTDGAALPLGRARFVANPGSVGQPRDGDARAAYSTVDTEAGVVSFHRVAYDVAVTQERMRSAGLPLSLVQRLSLGR